MIKNLSSQIQKQGPSQDKAITHLYDVFTPEVVKNILEQLSQSEK